MRTWLLALSGFVLAPATAPSTGVPAPGPAPFGRYVEARTAAVFAGACHYGGQWTLEGREAVLAWRFEGGTAGGVDLGGVEVAALVRGEANLASAPGPGAGRRSVIYVDREAGAEQRNAAVALIRERCSAVLGEVVAVVATGVGVRAEGEACSVSVADRIAIEGALLPDRRCCAMPFQVWYETLAPAREPLVVCNRTFRCDESELGVRFSRADENDGFAARFAFPAARAAGKAFGTREAASCGADAARTGG